MLPFGVTQSHSHRHKGAQLVSNPHTPPPPSLSRVEARGAESQPTSRPRGAGARAPRSRGRGPPWPAPPYPGVRSAEAGHRARSFGWSRCGRTSRPERRAEGQCGRRAERSGLGPAHSGWRGGPWAPPLGPSGEPGGGRRRGPRAVAPAPPAGEGRRGRPGSRSVPARSEAPQTPTRTTSQHVGKEDCHLRRHRQDRAHHAGAGAASRHELGRAGGRAGDVSGCTGRALGKDIVGLAEVGAGHQCLGV